MEYTNEQIFISLTNDTLDLNSAFKFINLDNCGGNSLFIGTTRGYEEDVEKCQTHKIVGLYYEAYEQMALKEMVRIVEEIMKNNSEIKRSYVVHRLGMVNSGEASILIGTCSKSRLDCSEATMKILCKVKEQVPIWKKIVYDNCDNNFNDNCDDENSKTGNETKSSISKPETTLQTNWILKSEAFWLKK